MTFDKLAGECCAADSSPRRVENRPSQPALEYRVTTHAESLRRMLARLPAQKIEDPPETAASRPLAALTTRSTEDFSIALLDAWSVAADVITFYQERIANEGFLRTAVERRSIGELGQAIGYELSPGVSASAFLAFTVEDVPGAPGVALVPAGTKVQSIPAQGQLPQTFETSAAVTARAEYNALRPRATYPQELAIYQDPAETDSTRQQKLVLLGLSMRFPDGTAGRKVVASADLGRVFPLDPSVELPPDQDLAVVEVERIYLAGTNTGLKNGQPLLFVGKRGAESMPLVLVARLVQAELALGRTRVDLAAQPVVPTVEPLRLLPAVVRLRRLEFIQDRVGPVIRQQQWRERDLSAFLSIQGWSGRSLARHINFVRLRTPAPPPAIAAGRSDVAAGVFGFQARAGFFGHNAPAFAALPDPKPAAFPNWDGDSGWEIWKRNAAAPSPYYATGIAPADVYLERVFADVEPNSWTLFDNTNGARFTPFWIRGVHEASVTGFSLSGKATGLELAAADGNDLAENDTSKPTRFSVRGTTAHVQSSRLELADLPLDEPLAKGLQELELDRLVLGLPLGQAVILSGERDDLRGVVVHEALVLTEVIHRGGLTVLEFADTPLRHTYVRNTVTINANVAEATHGETVSEVLGSGDGSRAHQQFSLVKPPLTYVSAATGAGRRAALLVRVNGVLWEEKAALYGLDGQSENYVIRSAEGGRTRIQFGDGERGARLPTGAENVTATYRSGIGLAGMVAADALTLLQTRPFGIRGVTNPLPAGGAADPEDRDAARENAPLTVLTLDRIVSLRDYEDFARAFAGVGKAQAVPLWDDDAWLVHLTIAAAAPPSSDPSEPAAGLATREVDLASPLYRNLVDAIRANHDPAHRFRVETYQPLFFNVRARVLVDPRHQRQSVLTAVEDALKGTFSFERRGFAQRVTAAEVITAIQGVPGVLAADLRQLFLYRDDRRPPDPAVEDVSDVLNARPTRRLDGATRLAELLLINPVGIAVEEMRP